LLFFLVTVDAVVSEWAVSMKLLESWIVYDGDECGLTVRELAKWLKNRPILLWTTPHRTLHSSRNTSFMEPKENSNLPLI